MKKTHYVLLGIFVLFTLNVQAQIPDYYGFDSTDIQIEVKGDFDTEIPTLNYAVQDANPIPLPPTIQPRRVYFIHGLGGNGTSWTCAQLAFWDSTENDGSFTARKCVPLRLDYTLDTHGSINNAAFSIKQDIYGYTCDDLGTNAMDPSKAFLIAHSQGGVVSRGLLNLDFFQMPEPDSTRGYGGLVTVSSPLQGARILNNTDDILDMANDACMSLTAPITAQSCWVDLLFKNIGLDLSQIQSTGCTFVSNTVAPFLFKDNLDPLTADYCVGADYIDRLNNNAIDTSRNSDYNALHKMAFYGVESQENLFWKTVNWFANSPNSGPNNSIGVWEANDDYYFFNNTVQPLIDTFEFKKQYWENRSNNTLLGLNWVLGDGIVRKKKCIEHMNAWNNGVVWLNYEACSQWEACIGAREMTVTFDTLYVCDCEEQGGGGYGYWSIYVNDLSDCALEPGCWATNRTRIFSTTIPTYKPNDGVVLNESAMNLPGHTNPPVQINGYIKSDGTQSGSSHMQIRNDIGVRNAFTILLDGGYDPFFSTQDQ